MFIVALLTIAKTGKQLKCPSTDEWIKKMQHIYTVKYCCFSSSDLGQPRASGSLPQPGGKDVPEKGKSDLRVPVKGYWYIR